MRALITGANRGLGEAVAARLIRDGADAILLDVDPAIEETAARLALGREGAVIAGVAGSVADEAICERAFHMAADLLGGLDVVVNIAGIGGPTSMVVDTAVADFRHTLEVNLVGTFLFSRAGASMMIGQGTGGCIINTSSIFAQQAVVRGAPYCASKAGVSLLTQTLALELAPHGIRVNAIAPGNMATEMHWDELRSRAEVAGTTLDDEREAVRASIPLGRHGTGDDIAGCVAWLASPDSSYVTGQTIGVNGGVYLT
jgi:NAD(P)-dependent dehydrogenase (short-subunit alcohol dehydrogenase family)